MTDFEFTSPLSIAASASETQSPVKTTDQNVQQISNPNYETLSFNTETYYTISEWNLNGWFSVRNAYNKEFKQQVINFIDSDFLILPEIHCLDDQKLEMPGYHFVQKNRVTGANRGKGSGGIAIGLKTNLLLDHEIIGGGNSASSFCFQRKKVTVLLTSPRVGIIQVSLSLGGQLLQQQLPFTTGSQ